MSEELITEFQNILSELEEAFGCKLRGGHSFEFDMCGCWAHKYCVRCGVGKYPELASKDLHTIKNELGKMMEEEYNERKSTGTN